VLRHRILPSYNAQGEGLDADSLITRLIQSAKTRLPAALAK
jgi:hypothetical protein